MRSCTAWIHFFFKQYYILNVVSMVDVYPLCYVMVCESHSDNKNLSVTMIFVTYYLFIQMVEYQNVNEHSARLYQEYIIIIYSWLYDGL